VPNVVDTRKEGFLANGKGSSLAAGGINYNSLMALKAMNTLRELEERAEAAEWMPLGTFAVSTHEKDVEPSHVIQIAVSKDGIVSGTLHNIDTDRCQSVQGQVDMATCDSSRHLPASAVPCASG
jgi:hypothetical protein